MERPIVRPIDELDFELYEPFTCVNIIIPKGFRTNGANVPRLLWSIYPPNSPRYLGAIILHDYLTEIAKDYNDYVFADNKFNEAMKELEVSNFYRIPMVFAVRTYHFIRYKILRLY